MDEKVRRRKRQCPVELNINWQNLLSKKKAYIRDLIKHPENRYHHNSYGTDPSKESLELTLLEKHLVFLDQESQNRIEEMLVKARAIGYEINSHPQGEKYTQQGNLCIRGKRGNLPLYGFINPLGKLSLDRRLKISYETKWINSLTINYRKINMIVRDNFLVALLKVEEKRSW